MAELINSGIDIKVLYISLSGFDTHVFQKNKHKNLLKTYSDGVTALVKDLKQNNRFEDVLIMTFSEFGRRVKQNKSGGTDHGTANNMFVIGKNIKNAGMQNQLNDLSDLDNFDLKHEIDFRQVYASVLNKWLECDDEIILGRRFEKMDFI